MFSGAQSQVKLKLRVKGFNLTECAHLYRIDGTNDTYINDKQICAGDETIGGSCNGDSGDLD